MNPIAALAIGGVLLGFGAGDLHYNHDQRGWVSLGIGVLGLATAYATRRRG